MTFIWQFGTFWQHTILPIFWWSSILANQFCINLAATNNFIADSIVENLVFLSVKYIVLIIFGQKELATKCTDGFHWLIKITW